MDLTPSFHQDTTPKPLSEAETQVACLIPRQKTNKEIAAILGRSIKTVEAQISSIRLKWRCSGRVAIALKAIALKLITFEEALAAGNLLPLIILFL